MHKINTSHLKTGLVLAEDLTKEGIVLFERFKVLEYKDIITIQEYFDTCKILSLRELEPLLLNNSSFSMKYTSFLVGSFDMLFSYIFNDDIGGFERVSKYLFKEISGNREVLTSLVRLRLSHGYTYNHSVNVALLSLKLGSVLELTDVELHRLILGGILHDLGKLYIDNKILDKAGRLTDYEFDCIKQHPSLGFTLVNKLSYLDSEVTNIVHQHHEKLNGSGYPQKLSSDDIHPLSKIVTVCDMFDAITSKRSYHEARSYTNCLDIMSKGVESGELHRDLVDLLFQRTVTYPLDTYLVLSNGGSGFTVTVDYINNRPVVYDNNRRVCYNLSEMRDIKILYAM